MDTATARWNVLGTTALVAVADPLALPAARAAVEVELEAIDRACSRFRADSELTAVNAAAGRPQAVGELTLAAIEAGIDAARTTGGLVDPTLGRQIVSCGYDRDWSLLARSPGAPAITSAAAPPKIRVSRRSAWSSVLVDRHRGTVSVPRGVELDLGATAKALCADRSAAAAAASARCGVLVSLGGDIAVAGSAPSGGWPIAIADDHRAPATGDMPVVTIAAGGLATSSTSARRWVHRGRQMHHILDPATGEPVSEVWSTVSVAAPSCLEANIAATAALVAGERAEPMLRARGLPARLVAAGGEVRLTGAWPAQGKLAC